MRFSFLLAAGSCIVGLLPLGVPAGESARTTALLKKFAGEFVLLRPGTEKFPATFVMGTAEGPADEQPAHKVTFQRPFAMAKYEVTQELFAAVLGSNPS